MAAAQPGTAAVRARALQVPGALALGCLLAFVATAVVLQFARTDLDWGRDTLSIYLHGPGGLALRVAYGLLACAVVALGTALYRNAEGSRRSAAAPLLFWVAALGLLGVAVGDSWLPTRAPLLWPLVHGLSAITAFLCASVGLLLQAWYLRREPGWELHGRRLWYWAWLGFSLLWAHVLLRDTPRGAGQKLVIAVIVGWLLYAAWTSWRAARCNPR